MSRLNLAVVLLATGLTGWSLCSQADTPLGTQLERIGEQRSLLEAKRQMQEVELKVLANEKAIAAARAADSGATELAPGDLPQVKGIRGVPDQLHAMLVFATGEEAPVSAGDVIGNHLRITRITPTRVLVQNTRNKHGAVMALRNYAPRQQAGPGQANPVNPVMLTQTPPPPPPAGVPGPHP